MKNQKIYNKLISILLLLIIAVLLLTYKSFISFQNKIANSSPKIDLSTFINPSYNENSNHNIDIVAIGNSDLYSAVNPLQLWNEYGYTSFLCSHPKQNMALSYFSLKEILIPQHPKLIILEVDNFFESRGDDQIESYIEDIYKLTKPLYKNTPQWEQVKHMPSHARTPYNGYYYNTDTVPYYNDFSYLYTNSNLNTNVSEYTLKYLPKLIDTANNSNIPILFISVPSANSWSYAKHDVVQQFANQYHIPFLDLNLDEGIRNFGFNWTTDSRDGGNHLNHSGATKLTSYLGAYLNTNYDLPNHLSDESYNDWNIRYEEFFNSSHL